MTDLAGVRASAADEPSEKRRRTIVALASSVTVHVAIFAVVTFLLKIMVSPLPLLTEVSLSGPMVPRGAGMETSLSPPAAVEQPAPVPGERPLEKDSATAKIQTQRETGEKILQQRPTPRPRKLTAQEIRQRFLKQFGGQKGVVRPGQPPSESQELPAGMGEEGTVGMPTGTEITGDILSRGVLTLEKPVCRERLPSVYEVTLLISVAPDGRVLDTIKVLSIASKQDLVHASLTAIKKWRFQPLPSGSAPVLQSGTITFKFVPE